MPKRDPKIDPMPEDEFEKTPRGNLLSTRYLVIEVSLSRLGLFLEFCDGPYRGCTTRKHIREFRKWAATATVVRQAEEGK